MIGRVRRTLLLVPIALALAACGGGGDGGGSDTHPLGEQVVVEHAEASGAKRSTTLGIAVTKVRKGTQQQLADGGFKLDPEDETSTPYYVDATIENQGSSPISRRQLVSMEDEDGTSISSTTVISLGGPAYAPCPQDEDADLAPGKSHQRCSIFLVPEGLTPKRVSFLPYDPDTPTDFVYWDVD
jgi:hypothetical protein